MNILVVSVHPKSRGGISSVVIMQSKALNNKVTLFHLSPSSSEDKTRWRKMIRWLKAIIQFPFLLLPNSIDLVHVHGSAAGSFPRKIPFMLLSKLFRKKVIYHMHSGAPEHYINQPSWIKSNIIQCLLNRYDGLVVLSDHWQSVLAPYVRIPMYSVFNAVEPRKLPDATSVNKPFTVLISGETGYRKGHFTLLKIVQQLSSYQNIVFNVAGAGKDLKRLQTIASVQGLNDSIQWLGWLSPAQLDQEYANADLFILPTHSEGMPMAILEAMFAGLPVLSTPVGSIPDCIAEGKNGYLFAPEDVKGFAEKILALKDDPALMKQLSENARLTAHSQFTPKKFSQNIRAVYQQVLIGNNQQRSKHDRKTDNNNDKLRKTAI
ncbi:glycosyltransferase family 4 protein [Candidatus Sororendozoicomonas aggregata]|uniref:glycosyltransferase family 4 protein n=1 Tax=Candidatus Sororendozoicomonas aggregata TaxID=3073239 RepID=UPI002ED254CC